MRRGGSVVRVPTARGTTENEHIIQVLLSTKMKNTNYYKNAHKYFCGLNVLKAEGKFEGEKN